MNHLYLEEFERKIEYTFLNKHLLRLALTHSSYANEIKRGGHENNERLEFLGDAVLELCVSAELYRLFPDAREGSLTRMRSALVNEASLARIAVENGLDAQIRLGVGEERQGGRSRPAILADAVEAVLGAIYEDGGLVAARFAVAGIFAGHWPREAIGAQERDCKSLLQQVCQHVFHEPPAYALERTSGPEHAKIFEVKVCLPDGRVFHAANTSRKRAEQDAAAQALAMLRE